MRIPYLQQAMAGRAGPFDFLMGGWLLLVAWGIGQFIFQMPLFFLPSSPEAQQAVVDMQTATLEGAADGGAVAAALAGVAVLAGVLVGFVGYLMYRTTSGIAARIGQVLGLLGVGLSVYGFLVTTAGQDPAALEASQRWLNALLSASPVAYGLILLSFVGAIVGGWMVQRWVHGRTFTSLLTAARRFRWMRMVWVLLLTWGVYAAMGVFGEFVLGKGEVYANPERSRMLPYVVATLLFIPIQCAAEEIMFRGYFNQALARIIPSTLAVFALTSLAFGALHLANPEIASAREGGVFLPVFAGYVMFGFVLSLMVWVDNGLEAAIGVHIANNAWAATFVNYEGSVLPIPGLFVAVPDPARDSWIAMLTLSLVLLGVWLTRKPLGTPGEPLLAQRGATPGAGNGVVAS